MSQQATYFRFLLALASNEKLPFALHVFIRKNFYVLRYVVAFTVNYSYCTPDDGCGKYPKLVEWSCSKTKVLVLLCTELRT
jgi:hypothetical protein